MINSNPGNGPAVQKDSSGNVPAKAKSKESSGEETQKKKTTSQYRNYDRTQQKGHGSFQYRSMTSKRQGVVRQKTPSTGTAQNTGAHRPQEAVKNAQSQQLKGRVQKPVQTQQYNDRVQKTMQASQHKDRVQKTAAGPAHRERSGQRNQQRQRPGAISMTETTMKTHKYQRIRKPAVRPDMPVHIIPLGGLNEIGKNMTAYECGNDIIVVDCGLAFPDDDLLGIDLVIPDITWLLQNKNRVRCILLTHGHEDHIGGLPYVLKNLNVPVYGTRLTLGIVEGKLKEHGLLGRVSLNVVEPGDKVRFGCMAVEFINVTHSIAGSLAMAIYTPAGTIVHTGDFKIDCTPINGQMIDVARLGEIGKEGVLALLMDSTNAERPGYTMSERNVGKSFDRLFKEAEGKRIIVATFASNVHRVQQIVNFAQRYGRHVAISGRSMVNVCSIAMELGYLSAPEGLMVDIDEMERYPRDKMVIITTGSQGEPMSALYRMACGEHRKVVVGPSDFIIISANPIPGNEKTVSRVVNELLKLGADVIYERLQKVHVSGHACQEELKLMIGLCHPKFFMPVHGEYRHLKKNYGLAISMGIQPENILITDIGKVVELTQNSMKVIGSVPSGRVLVDGLGVGDVGSIVLRDRKHLAEDGLIIVVATIDRKNGTIIAGPDIVSRGFVYVRESEGLIDGARACAKQVLEECSSSGVTEWSSIKTRLKDSISKQLYEKTKRSPMILPVIMEV